jgi:oligopeptide transport system substrate-binding protein
VPWAHLAMSVHLRWALAWTLMLGTLPAQEAAPAVAAADAAGLPAWRARLLPATSAWKAVSQDFIFNNDTEPQTLDPQIMTGTPECRLALALGEGLIGYHPETLSPVPGVAERWEASLDGMEYVFHLRADACWSDGSPLTAQDFYRSWQRVLNPATGSLYAYQLYPVEHAEDIHLRQGAPASLGVTVVDAHTLRVRLAHPCPYFLDLCAFPTLMPVPEGPVRQYGERWAQEGRFLGNGPFRLSAWRPRERVVMLANEHYWDHAHVILRSITALPYDDVETAYKKYQDGSLQWMPSVPISKFNDLQRNSDYYTMPYLGTYFYRFNCSKEPFNDVRVRRAFSLAIDRTVITDHVLKAGQLPATWFCPDVAGYQHVEGLAYDPLQARALLAAAGYGPGGRPFPVVHLLSNMTTAHKQVAESVVQQWAANLGVTVGLEYSEWKVYLTRVDSQDYQIARASWIGDYGDPNTFFDMWVTDGGNNHTGWSSPLYDRLLDDSQRQADPAKRIGLFKQMERLLVTDAFPIMPLYIYVNQGLLSEHVHGWYENVRDIHPFQYFWLE